MLNKVMLALVSAGVMTLSAATGVYKVTLFQDSVVNGQQLKAGNYKIEMKGDNTAVLKQGKQTVEIPAHLQGTSCCLYKHEDSLPGRKWHRWRRRVVKFKFRC